MTKHSKHSSNHSRIKLVVSTSTSESGTETQLLHVRRRMPKVVKSYDNFDRTKWSKFCDEIDTILKGTNEFVQIWQRVSFWSFIIGVSSIFLAIILSIAMATSTAKVFPAFFMFFAIFHVIVVANIIFFGTLKKIIGKTYEDLELVCAKASSSSLSSEHFGVENAGGGEGSGRLPFPIFQLKQTDDAGRTTKSNSVFFAQQQQKKDREGGDAEEVEPKVSLVNTIDALYSKTYIDVITTTTIKRVTDVSNTNTAATESAEITDTGSISSIGSADACEMQDIEAAIRHLYYEGNMEYDGEEGYDSD